MEIEITVSVVIEYTGKPKQFTDEEKEERKAAAVKDIRRALRRAEEAGGFDELGNDLTIFDVRRGTR
jgi:hypothetical protein